MCIVKKVPLANIRENVKRNQVLGIWKFLSWKIDFNLIHIFKEIKKEKDVKEKFLGTVYQAD